MLAALADRVVLGTHHEPGAMPDIDWEDIITRYEQVMDGSENITK